MMHFGLKNLQANSTRGVQNAYDSRWSTIIEERQTNQRIGKLQSEDHAKRVNKCFLLFQRRFYEE